MKEWKGFRKGINLGGWLSQCDYSEERLECFITEKDFATIASWGLDHVRLPLDYNVIELPENKGFDYIDRAVEYSRKYGLNIIIDLHKTKGFSFDACENQSGFFESAELQEYFYSIWETLAGRYGNDPEHIGFELLNEVTNKEYIDEWNRIATECIKHIRKFAQNTVILVGSYYNNSVSTVFALDKPYDDRVIYNFHCYDPLFFTHQGAHWADLIVDKSKRLSFDESEASVEYFEDLFASALEAAEKNNTMLYCGEYGVIEFASPEDTVKWFRAINEVFEKHGIGRSAWSYKEMNFGVVDERMDAVRSELLTVL